MEKTESNPNLSPLVRAFMLIVAIVVVVGGALFFLPDIVGSIWPWRLTPFNTRFLGAIYLAELSIVVIMVFKNRWAPGRIILPLALTFTVIVSIISLLYLQIFDFRRVITWLWFFLYLVPVLASAYFIWFYRHWPATLQQMPAIWRNYLLGQGIAFSLYGIGLLLIPGVFSGFWPWPIDDFHARVYSAIFLTGATGSFLTWKSAAPIELLSFGVSQFMLGFFAILGLVIVDASVHRVNWSSLGTWLWIVIFADLLVAGVAMVWYARRPGLRSV
jgi:hypothetical protein